MKMSHVFIIFADISLLLFCVFCLGYTFVEIKKDEPETVLFEKTIEFPELDGASSVSYIGNRDSIEIVIPREGGRFIVNEQSVMKTEITAALGDVEDKTVILCINPDAPSGDTLYLYSILNDLNAKVSVVHLLEEKEYVQK